MQLTDEIRERLSAVLQEKHITEYRMAEDLGISATTVANYRTGKVTKADKTKMEAICNYLEISIMWLCTGQNEVSEPKSTYHKGTPKTETVENKIDQILLKIQAQDAQYLNIHKDINQIWAQLNTLCQQVNKLTEK